VRRLVSPRLPSVIFHVRHVIVSGQLNNPFVRFSEKKFKFHMTVLHDSDVQTRLSVLPSPTLRKGRDVVYEGVLQLLCPLFLVLPTMTAWHVEGAWDACESVKSTRQMVDFGWLTTTSC